METKKGISEKLKAMSKQQKMMASIGVLVIAVALVVGSVFLLKDTKPSIELKKDVFVFEYGTRYSDKKSDYINADEDVLQKTKITINGKDISKQPQPESENAFRKDYAIGKYEAIAEYKDEKLKFTIEIKDTIAPEFVDFKDRVEIPRDTDAEKLKLFFTTNDVSLESELTIDSSKVDFSKAGEYTAKATIEDPSKNKTTKAFSVVVGEKSEAELNAEKVKAEEDARQEQINKQQEQQNQQNVNTGGNTQSGSNTGGSTGGSTGGGSTGGGNTGGGGTCSFTGWQMVGNSGYANHDWATADAWAEANWPSSYSGYGIYSTKDNCGNAGWTVDWEK